MSWWTVAWIVWGVYFAVVEGMALANSRGSDTLSEHVWAFVGVGPAGGAAAHRRVTGWARVRRVAVGLFMLALSVHFLIGSDRVGNGVLIGSAVVLGLAVTGTGVVRAVRRRRAGAARRRT